MPTRTALARLGLERNWMTLVPLVGTERLLSISLADNLFFAQTNLANFYVFEAESGRLLWTAHLGHQTGSARPASVNSRLVFVTNSNQLFALERQTGRVVWVTNLGVLPTSPTACDEQQVMVGLSNGKLASYLIYDLADKKKALYDIPRPYWNWQTQGATVDVPTAAGRSSSWRSAGVTVSFTWPCPRCRGTNPAVMLYRIATGARSPPAGNVRDTDRADPIG